MWHERRPGVLAAKTMVADVDELTSIASIGTNEGVLTTASIHLIEGHDDGETLRDLLKAAGSVSTVALKITLFLADWTL